MASVPTLDPERLERLRRGVPLVLSPTGRFRLGGEDVTHPRVEAALRAGLDVSEQGEPIVRLAAQWCYLSIEDCPLRATGVLERDDALWIRLDDGRELPLNVAALWEQPQRGLQTTAPSRASGRPLAVRFTNAAQMQLATWVEFEDDAPVLTYRRNKVRIPDTPPPALATEGA